MLWKGAQPRLSVRFFPLMPSSELSRVKRGRPCRQVVRTDPTRHYSGQIRAASAASRRTRSAEHGRSCSESHESDPWRLTVRRECGCRVVGQIMPSRVVREPAGSLIACA